MPGAFCSDLYTIAILLKVRGPSESGADTPEKKPSHCRGPAAHEDDALAFETHVLL